MHLHHYKDGVCVDPRAPGGPCGERQVYRPPTGQRAEYADVLVSKEDLRNVLEDAVALLDLHGCSSDDDEVVTRLYKLLDGG